MGPRGSRHEQRESGPPRALGNASSGRRSLPVAGFRAGLDFAIRARGQGAQTGPWHHRPLVQFRTLAGKRGREYTFDHLDADLRPTPPRKHVGRSSDARIIYRRRESALRRHNSRRRFILRGRPSLKKRVPYVCIWNSERKLKGRRT